MAFPGVAVIVGAATGIGRATAELFVKRGCTKVVLGDTNASALNETKKQLLQLNTSAEVADGACDVTSEDSVDNFVAKAASTFGRIDHACNAGGVLLPGPANDIGTKELEKRFNISARGMLMCQRAEIIQMLKQEPVQPPDTPFPIRGTIANVASIAALTAYGSREPERVTNLAMLGFTKANARRYASSHIRLNAVCAGLIDTPIVGQLLDAETTSVVEVSKDVALGRHPTELDIAEGLYWMSMPLTSFATGIAIPIHGEGVLAPALTFVDRYALSSLVRDGRHLTFRAIEGNSLAQKQAFLKNRLVAQVASGNKSIMHFYSYNQKKPLIKKA